MRAFSTLLCYRSSSYLAAWEAYVFASTLSTDLSLASLEKFIDALSLICCFISLLYLNFLVFSKSFLSCSLFICLKSSNLAAASSPSISGESLYFGDFYTFLPDNFIFLGNGLGSVCTYIVSSFILLTSLIGNVPSYLRFTCD